MLKIKDNVDLKELEKFGFKFTTDDRWCGSNRDERPRYEKDGIIDDKGRSWGYFYIEVETRMVYFETEWWYDIFDDYVDREIEPLIQAGLVEKV